MSYGTDVCYLYRVIRVGSDDSYIGISKNPRQRWTDHRKAARDGSPTLFHRKLRAHGVDAFEWKIIAKCFTPAAAKLLEQIAIAIGLGSMNLTKGGDGVFGRQLTDRHRAAIIECNKKRAGTKKSADALAKMKATQQSKSEYYSQIRKGVPWTEARRRAQKH